MQQQQEDQDKIKNRNTTVRFEDVPVALAAAGSGVEKPIGEAMLQIDMMLGKERKVTVRGETQTGNNLVLNLIKPLQKAR